MGIQGRSRRACSPVHGLIGSLKIASTIGEAAAEVAASSFEEQEMANRKSNTGTEGSQEQSDLDQTIGEAAAEVAEADTSGLLLASKQGEEDIYIHPSTKADHVRCGWKVKE
jgi:beta-glucosidase-like glycosyl hydrolase